MSLELSREARERLGRAALEWVLEYFDRSAEPPVYPAVAPADVHARVAEPLPQAPQDPARVLEEFARVAALGRKNGHPRMFGYVQSSGNFAGTIGDFLAAALNQNVTSWRSAPSATALELQVIDWIKSLVGFEQGSGLILSGGSAANMVGLATALRASTAADLNTRGVVALPGPPRVYASARVHMSIPKAAALLGIGRDAVHTVPSDPDGRIDMAALEAAVRADRAAGCHLVSVVANAGDVNTGAIDPLDQLADLCARERLWLHVDGAYGGFAAAVPAMADAFRGMRRADSIALDPHKWLFAPLDAGCLLVRDEAQLRRTLSHGAAYIDVIGDREMSDYAFWDVSPELSRRFRALKIWFALKCHGARAFVDTIARNIELAQRLASAIDASKDFERLAPAPLSIVCFRYRRRAPGEDEAALNALNRRLMVAVQREGRSYVSNAMIGASFALRACIVNHRTTEEDVALLMDDIRGAAARLEGEPGE